MFAHVVNFLFSPLSMEIFSKVPVRNKQNFRYHRYYILMELKQQTINDAAANLAMPHYLFPKH